MVYPFRNSSANHSASKERESERERLPLWQAESGAGGKMGTLATRSVQ